MGPVKLGLPDYVQPTRLDIRHRVQCRSILRGSCGLASTFYRPKVTGTYGNSHESQPGLKLPAPLILVSENEQLKADKIQLTHMSSTIQAEDAVIKLQGELVKCKDDKLQEPRGIDCCTKGCAADIDNEKKIQT